MLGRLIQKIREDQEVRRIGFPDDPPKVRVGTILVVLAALAVGGVVANQLTWASIEGFGR